MHPDLSAEHLTVQRVFERLAFYRRMSLQHGRDHVFPEQEDLARYLRLNVRTVRRGLERLHELGLIATRRTGRNNRYYFLDPQPVSPPVATGGPTPPPENPSPATGQNVRSDRTKCPVALIGINEKERNNSSSSANDPKPAAADLFAPLENADARTALLALDYPEPLIDQAIRAHGPEFILRAATFCSERFRDKTLPPVKNAVGFIRSLFRDPVQFGWSLINGHWELPPIAAAAVKPTAAERVARQRQHLQELNGDKPAKPLPEGVSLAEEHKRRLQAARAHHERTDP
ncbi:MAG: helix-turn-helix transcriptional regulator [Gemmatimonadales bacterium]|nr:helix-turn-helix transcriptional regulator [Gemmatimonadales bacterium]